MSTPARVTWLHLSDFHLREKTGWAQDLVLKSMLDDIRSRYGSTNHPDLLFLTGDIAFSGKEKEYSYAEQFVAQLREALGLAPARVFVVPGNHDVDREREEDAFVGARQLLNSPSEVDRFFGNEGRRKTLFSRQAAFRAFTKRIGPDDGDGLTDSSYGHSRVVQVGPLRVRVLLIDSTWLSEGGEGDVGKLLVGERQIVDCVSKAGGLGCLTFALLHHPFAWLREFEQVAIENLLIQRAHLCLRGHVHAPDVRAIDTAQGKLTTITGVAAFDTRDYKNSYMWCSLDLATGEGEQVVHHYERAGHVWTATGRARWSLPGNPRGAADVAAVKAIVDREGVRFSSYIACLGADLMSEVPIVVRAGTLTFVNFDVALPDMVSDAGKAVARLRHHLFWREVWEDTSWIAETEQRVRALETALASVAETHPTELAAREQSCRELLNALAPKEHIALAVVSELQSKLSSGDVAGAKEILSRWLDSDVLKPTEELELRRIEVRTLRMEKSLPEARASSERLLACRERTPLDIALASSCAFEAGDHKRASELICEALEAGAPKEAVKQLALQIAGATGDKNLVDKVRT